MNNRAIYLSGGGARCAYQAGVLKGIQEIIRSPTLPVKILSGVSAGSVNAAFLSMYPGDFNYAVNSLVELWSKVTCDQIFQTTNFSLLTSVIRNILSLFNVRVKRGGYLLNTKPFKTYLKTHLNFDLINRNIEMGLVSDLEIITSCYDLTETISFYKSFQEKKIWKRSGHVSYATNIHYRHILASSSLPLFFPAVKIKNLFYGDGGTHLTSPLRGAIRLGADQLLIIGTRAKPHSETPKSKKTRKNSITFAKILGSILGALFSGSLERDIELIGKINDIIGFQESPHKEWRKIKTLYIHPSKNLSKVSQTKQNVLPTFLRYLMSILGPKEQRGELISFLLFEGEFCKTLIDIGYHDALAHKNEIENFFQI